MKKSTFTLLFSLSIYWLAAQCPTGTIVFSTQGQIDSFPINYPNCSEMNGNVTISGSGIVRLDSLHSLRKMRGVWIKQTGLADLSGFDNLDSIKGCLRVVDNPVLTSFTGLEKLKYVGNCSIYFPPNGALEYGMYIFGNPLLVSLSSLGNLRRIEGSLEIISNAALSSLDGLDSLNTLGGCLSIEYNPELTTLEPLSQIRALGSNGIDDSEWQLTIIANDKLTTLKGLDSIPLSISLPVYIQSCWLLATCEVLSICQFIQKGGPATISDNAAGCNSVPEVEAACAVPTHEFFSEKIKLTPNPATNFLQIQLNDPEKWEINLFDLQGRRVFQQMVSGDQIIGLKDWPSGIYTLRAVSGERVFAGKIVKQ